MATLLAKIADSESFTALIAKTGLPIALFVTGCPWHLAQQESSKTKWGFAAGFCVSHSSLA